MKKVVLNRNALLGYRVWGAVADQSKLGSKGPLKAGTKGPLRVGAKGKPRPT